MPEQNPFLLDTHIWIWFMEASSDLPQPIIARINEAAQQKQLIIAAISLWEVCLLFDKKRIRLEKDAFTWLTDALLYPGLACSPLTPAIAAQAYKLPENFHGDPADRMIVSTALVENATLLTRDTGILQYAKTGHVKVLAA